MVFLTKPVMAGVDIGGTAIKMALIDSDGKILCRREMPTPSGADGVIDLIAEAIPALAVESGRTPSLLAGIGVGVAGTVDEQTGIVHEANNLGWNDTPLKQQLEQRVGLQVHVDNDANTAALGEMWRGAGQGATHLVAVTLGTGIGAGIVVNGQLVRGQNGFAGEIGHLTMQPQDGFPCSCGKSGCLESYASATAIIREAVNAAQTGGSTYLGELLDRHGALSAKDVFAAAKAGDPAAVAIVERACFYLGVGLSHVANLFNPEKIMICGGVSAAGDFLLDRVRSSFQRHSLPQTACEIVSAALGNDAGVIGAAWLIRSRLPGS